MTDNRTTELLDGLRNVGNLHEFAELFGFDWHDESDWTWHDVAVKMADELEQAIAATLGSGTCELEPLSALDVTFNMLDQTEWGACSECGCAVPMDARFCNECGKAVSE